MSALGSGVNDVMGLCPLGVTVNVRIEPKSAVKAETPI